MQNLKIFRILCVLIPAADPGFPIGGCRPVWGGGEALTSDDGTFQQKHM